MQMVDLSEIRKQAHYYHNLGEPWHFHILSPTCVFNTHGKQYAFILEHSGDNTSLVYYSNNAQKKLGGELSPLLHRPDKVSDTQSEAYEPSETERIILERAQKLNVEGIEWHHHVLFPKCTFNQHSPKFCLILEDPETNQTLESITDNEPVEVLKLLEPLFYASKPSKN